MKLIDFKLGHLDLLNDSCLKSDHVNLEQLKTFIETKRDCDVIKTLVDDDRVICIWGVVELWDGVGEAYNIKTEYLKPKHFRYLQKNFKQVTDTFDRVQTHSKKGEYVKWHEMLGFEEEATMKKYINGEDCTLWAIVN